MNAVRKSSPIPELSGRRLKVSYERGFGLQRRTAVCCRKKETPIALMIGLTLFVWRTRTGKAMRAVSYDAEASSMMGIDVDRVVTITFLLGSALAGAAGVMTGLIYQQINPYMGFGAGLKAFTAAVVGGIGNIGGAVLGGLLIGLTETFTVGYLSSAFSDIILYSILVIFLLFRSTGIRGAPVLQKV